MSKKPTKAPSPTKKASKTFPFTDRDAVILAESAFAAGRGMENEMLKDPGKRPYVLDSAAREFWIEYHMRSIPQAFATYGSGANWAKQRPGVTLMAVELGATAARFALADKVNASATVITVLLDHVEAATKQIRNDTRCKAVAAKGGRGIYCES